MRFRTLPATFLLKWTEMGTEIHPEISVKTALTGRGERGRYHIHSSFFLYLLNLGHWVLSQHAMSREEEFGSVSQGCDKQKDTHRRPSTLPKFRIRDQNWLVLMWSDSVNFWCQHIASKRCWKNRNNVLPARAALVILLNIYKTKENNKLSVTAAQEVHFERRATTMKLRFWL